MEVGVGKNVHRKPSGIRMQKKWEMNRCAIMEKEEETEEDLWM